MQKVNRPLSPAAQKSLAKWRSMISENEFSDLPSIVAADAVFYSPVEWHPYPGRELVCLLLRTAAGIYEGFEYKGEFADGENAVLEFSAHIGDIQVRGVHIIRFNVAGEFVNVEKMLRPEEGVKALGHAMGSKIGTQVKAALLTGTSGKSEILVAISEAISGMSEMMSRLDKSEVNSVPYKGSWTAGMLFRHVSKSLNAMSGAMRKEGRPVERDAGEKIPVLRETFLDFSTKLKSPDFIVPEDGPYEKKAISDELNNSLMQFKESSVDANLSDLVEGLPLGDITKLEILHFVLYHTQRHKFQMKRICDAIKDKANRIEVPS
jgi:hypothetical protein